MQEFPSNLPYPSAISLKKAGRALFSSVEGAPISRGRDMPVVTAAQVTWDLSESQTEDFLAWFYDVLSEGRKPFKIMLQGEGGMIERTARFTSALDQAFSGSGYEVSSTIELTNKPLYVIFALSEPVVTFARVNNQVLFTPSTLSPTSTSMIISYEIFVDGVNKGNSYSPVAADISKKIYVRANATGGVKVITSKSTAMLVLPEPITLTNPTITLAQVGSPLAYASATPSRVEPGVTVSYEIFVDGVSVGASYTPAAGDEAKIIFVRATLNGWIDAVSSQSASLSIESQPIVMSAPAITIARVGEPVAYSASTLAPASPETTISYEIFVNGVSMGSSYTPVEGDIGLPIFVRATSSGGTVPVTIDSAASVFVQGTFDPYAANVFLLAKMDGSDNGTTFTDSGPLGLVMTASGGAVTSTSDKKFGTASALFNGTGGVVHVNQGALKLWTDDLTVEMFFKLNAAGGGTRYIFGNTSGNIIVIAKDASDRILANVNYVGITSTTALAVGTWYHIAYTRKTGQGRLFINGELQASSGATQHAIGINTTELFIGSSAQVGLSTINARIDNLRVTKGVARYDATFTPPAAPF